MIRQYAIIELLVKMDADVTATDTVILESI